MNALTTRLDDLFTSSFGLSQPIAQSTSTSAATQPTDQDGDIELSNTRSAPSDPYHAKARKKGGIRKKGRKVSAKEMNKALERMDKLTSKSQKAVMKYQRRQISKQLWE